MIKSHHLNIQTYPQSLRPGVGHELQEESMKVLAPNNTQNQEIASVGLIILQNKSNSILFKSYRKLQGLSKDNIEYGVNV